MDGLVSRGDGVPARAERHSNRGSDRGERGNEGNARQQRLSAWHANSPADAILAAHYFCTPPVSTRQKTSVKTEDFAAVRDTPAGRPAHDPAGCRRAGASGEPGEFWAPRMLPGICVRVSPTSRGCHTVPIGCDSVRKEIRHVSPARSLPCLSRRSRLRDRRCGPHDSDVCVVRRVGAGNRGLAAGRCRGRIRRGHRRGSRHGQKRRRCDPSRRDHGRGWDVRRRPTATGIVRSRCERAPIRRPPDRPGG